MSDFSEIIQTLGEPGPLSAAVRLMIAMLCGGIIGIERGRRRRPAGFRTHMLVCMGAALTMLIGQYIAVGLASNPAYVGRTTDVSRLGAQVINGIGFLGAGTIIVTGRQEVKGLTTAAGLWASACMGLAIGAGFYLGAVLGGVLILMSITFMKYLESAVMSRARNINIYVELTDINDIGTVIDAIKSEKIRIYDIEINKADPNSGAYAGAVFSMRLPEKQPHSTIIAKLAGVGAIRSLEEI
ncbi:MAG: MgtC/SapB family protein [Clostridia bacterium]|nr:MgtC/SapB family protein [Clostridia bacterium]